MTTKKTTKKKPTKKSPAKKTAKKRTAKKKPASKRKDGLTAAQRKKYTNMARNIQKLDSWYSATTGAGTDMYDKFTDYRFRRKEQGLDQSELENMYIESDLAAVVVDRVVDDALRQGYTLKSTDDEYDDEILGEIVKWAEDKYGVTEVTTEARKWARLYGGGGVFVGANGSQASPIKLGTKVHSPCDTVKTTSQRIVGITTR